MGEKRFENPQTVNLQRVLNDTIAIQELIADADKDEPNTKSKKVRTRTYVYMLGIIFLWIGINSLHAKY